VKAAYALHSGRLPFRDAIGKFALSILQIGTGASLGREGPTVHICAGISSLLARVASLSRQNSRRMTSVGVAAGIAAAFNAPISAVTFTLEEIIGDLDQTMLSGVIVAAALAAAVERSILGQHPVFDIQRAYTMGPASSLFSYAILGLLAALVSVTFTDSLLNLRALPKIHRRTQMGSPHHRRSRYRSVGCGRAIVAEDYRDHRRRLSDSFPGINRFAVRQGPAGSLRPKTRGHRLFL